MHLNEVHFSRSKISQLELTTSRSTNIKTLIHKDCNVAEKQLNSVAETVDCKQLISHAIVNWQRDLSVQDADYESSASYACQKSWTISSTSTEQ